jgi:hypothetical protein
MLIRFENDLDDVLDWLDYHYSQSPTFMDNIRSYKRLGLGLAAIGVVLGMLMPAFVGLMTVAMGIFVYLSFPQMMYSQARSNARQMYEEGPMNGLIGRFELVADDDGVEIISEMERHFYKWDALDRVVQTDEHTFVYVNGLQAYVIPHDSVYEGDPSRLVDAKQQKQQRQLMGRRDRAPVVDDTPLLDEDRRLEERIDRAAAQHDGTVGERKPAGGREQFENGAEGYI